ncbi:MAG TPA: SDR family NAD(P)-dependent oxidoreductase [Povalibacter sp.]
MQFHQLADRFPKKRAFITGAGSGLGLALANALAADGWSLGLFDHNLERLTAVEGELAGAGVAVFAYPGDVTHADELTVAVNTFASSHDGLDLMINNAGVAVSGTVMNVALEDWDWIVRINLMGVVHGCRAAIPHLQRNRSGMLINVASAAAFVSAPEMAPYNTTKAAVLSLSETLANELRSIGTQVSVVMPSFFSSNLLDTYRGDAEGRATASQFMQEAKYSATDAAHDLLRMAAAGRHYIVIPRSARMLWRLKRWMPRTFLKTIATVRERVRRK